MVISPERLRILEPTEPAAIAARIKLYESYIAQGQRLTWGATDWLAKHRVRYVGAYGTEAQQKAAGLEVPAAAETSKQRAAAWALREQEAAKVRIAAAKNIGVAACPRGMEYNIHFYQECEPGYTKKWRYVKMGSRVTGYYCRCNVTTTSTTPTTPKVPAQGETCPRGLRYTKLTRWSACDAGYISTQGSGFSITGGSSILGEDLYPQWPGSECVCVDTPAGQAIIKSESEPKPTDLPRGENGEGGYFEDIFGFGDAGKTIGKIGNYIPIIIIGAIVVALLGLFKK